MRVWVAIWDGSAIICRLIAGMLQVSPVIKLACVAGGVLFVNGLDYLGELAAAGAALWLLAAVVLGLRTDPAHEDVPEPEPDPAPGPLAVDLDEPLEQYAPPPLVPEAIPAADLIAALHAVADRHAHIAALATHLHAPAEAVRTALRAAGIPITDVRMRGRGVSTGVSADVIPPLPSAEGTDSDDVVAAGQPPTNNSNNTARDFVVEDDPTNEHRAAVRWIKRT